MTGRKPNDNFKKLNFDLVKVNGKHAAKCHLCKNTIKNTGRSRLQAHRNVCRSVSVREGSSAKQERSRTEQERLILVPSQAQNENISNSQEVGTFEVMNDGTLIPDGNNNSDSSQRSNNNAEEDDQTLSSIDESFSNVSNLSYENVSLSLSTSSTPKRKKRKITDYLDQLSEEEEINFNQALAKMVFGCNLPFSVVESVHFKNFIKRLRLAYAEKLPSRKKISTTLLNQCYEDCINTARSNLGGEAVIVCDGWKNSSNNMKTVVTMLHTTDGGNAFINAWDFTSESETAEQLVSVITETKQIAKEKYNVDTFAVVSDNASAMVKMGGLLKHSLWHSTCNSHTGNLLAKDMLDKELCENLVLILKEFKQPDLEKSIVSSGGHRIKLPAETRWCSYRDCFKNFLDNLVYIKQITATTQKKIKPRVKELIFNDDFIDKVQQNLDIQDPVCNLINISQNPKTTLADAVNLWIDLDVPQQFKEQLKRRQDMALNEYALVAYYFHPLYENEKLTQSQKQQINKFLFTNLNSEGINEWDCFNTKSGVFRHLFLKKIEDPLVFWRIAKTECPQLGGLVLKLMKIPAASAQIERLFSNWGSIHTLLRNRLTFANSKKLLHIYFSLKEAVEDEEEYDIDEINE